MTAPELLQALAAAGLALVRTNAGLRVRGDPQRFTAELKAAMKEHREWLERQYRPATMPREMEFRWAATGAVDSHWRPGTGRPLPDQWRYVGDETWRALPQQQ